MSDNNVDAQGSRGVVIGSGNVQHNHNHFHASQPQREKHDVLRLDLAAAYYNREQLLDDITTTMAENPVSNLLFVGDGDDWHYGMHTCLAHKLSNLNPEGSCCGKIEWPKSNVSDFKIWRAVYEEFRGESEYQPSRSVEEIKTQVVENLMVFLRARKYGQCLVSFEIEQQAWNKDTLILVQKIQQDWVELHKRIIEQSRVELNIGLFFALKLENKSSAFSKLFGQKESLENFPLLEEMHRDFDNILVDVHRDDVDSWIEALQKLVEGQEGSWWDNLNLSMRKQFKFKKRRPHKDLYEKLLKDNKFKDALKA